MVRYIEKAAKKAIIAAGIMMMVISSKEINAMAAEFGDTQEERAEIIAEHCIDEWDKYGVWPSVAIAQAYLESSLGEHCNSNNYWGLHGGSYSYDTLEDGVEAYLQCINNGYYTNAPFADTPEEQIKNIVYGGYCESPDDYWPRVVSVINNYDLTKYDDMLRDKWEEEKELAEENEQLKAELEALKQENERLSSSLEDTTAEKESTAQELEELKQQIMNSFLPGSPAEDKSDNSQQTVTFDFLKLRENTN